MKRVVITEAETLVIDVDPGAGALITMRPDGGRFVETRHSRREIIAYRDGPRGEWIPEAAQHRCYVEPLYSVVYVQDGVPLDDACLKRAMDALWPCDCGCMAE